MVDTTYAEQRSNRERIFLKEEDYYRKIKEQNEMPGHFLSLSEEHKRRACHIILDASLLREVGKDWTPPFLERIPRSSGRIKQLYRTISELDNEQFDRLVKVMVDDES